MIDRGRWVLAAAIPLLVAACGGDRAEKHLAAGDRLFEETRYEEAAQEYRAGLDLDPASATAWNRLGMACRLQFNTSRESEWKDQELEAFQRAVEADSTYRPGRVNLGATLYYLGRKSEATPHLRRAIALQPNDPDRKELEALIADTTGVR